MSDRAVFVRVISLLLHLLQHPFAHQKGIALTDHLISELGGLHVW